MASADYTRLSAHLPAVYQEDAASFAQIDSYLGLADDLNRACLERIEDLGLVLSPAGRLLWPGDLTLDVGGDAVLGAYLALFDELSRWVAFAFPVSWGTGDEGVTKRRAFLAKAARLWRRRGTPRGFLYWFCFAFGIDEAHRPFLLEHFKAAGPPLPDPALRATLFVPSTTQFSDYLRRQEAIAFVERYAPAHVVMRVCWTRPDFAPLPPPAAGASQSDVNAYRAELRNLLCSITSFIDHENGIRIWECIDEGRTIDRLGVGRLPSE